MVFPSETSWLDRLEWTELVNLFKKKNTPRCENLVTFWNGTQGEVELPDLFDAVEEDGPRAETVLLTDETNLEPWVCQKVAFSWADQNSTIWALPFWSFLPVFLTPEVLDVRIDFLENGAKFYSPMEGEEEKKEKGNDSKLSKGKKKNLKCWKGKKKNSKCWKGKKKYSKCWKGKRKYSEFPKEMEKDSNHPLENLMSALGNRVLFLLEGFDKFEEEKREQVKQILRNKRDGNAQEHSLFHRASFLVISKDTSDTELPSLFEKQYFIRMKEESG